MLGARSYSECLAWLELELPWCISGLPIILLIVDYKCVYG